MDSNESDLSRYRHVPLNDAHRAVRLISFDNRGGDGTLRFNIFEFELSEKLTYNALFYEWGSRNSVQSILVSGQPFQIFENLYSFLLQLEIAGYTEAPIFADAICIDQTNIAGRNAQVQLMGEIYKCASTVLVWLGPAADGSDFVLDTCVSEHHTYQGGESYRAINMDAYPSFDREQAVNSLVAMVHRPYWGRLWIMQELFLVNKAILFSVNRSVGWSVFCDLAGIVDFMRIRQDFGFLHDPRLSDRACKHFNRLILILTGRGEHPSDIKDLAILSEKGRMRGRP